MIDLYYWTTPNGHKITIYLEETALAYKITPVNISKGEQFKAEFLAVSPNNRIPAIVDHEPTGGGAPNGMHSVMVDHHDNVWLTATGPGDASLKFRGFFVLRVDQAVFSNSWANP